MQDKKSISTTQNLKQEPLTMWGHGRGWAPAGKLPGFPAGTAYKLAGLKQR